MTESIEQKTGLIYGLIPKIMSEVGSIAKNRRGQGINYAFRGIDDAYLACQKPLSENGVFFVPQVLESKREERQSKSGSNITIAILKVKYQFFASDGSSITAIVDGEAMDSSDKAINKAMSAALKIALFQIFCIPTGELKDSEEHDMIIPPKPANNTVPMQNTSPYGSGGATRLITAPQVKRLWAIAGKNGWASTDVKTQLLKLGVHEPDKLNRVQYDKLIENIEKFPNPVPDYDGPEAA